MVVGIEIGYRRIQDDLLLQLLQRRRRAAADHQCASFYVFFSDMTFFGEGIIRPADKIDVTVKQIVYKDIRDAFHLGFGGKQDVGLSGQKGIQRIVIVEQRRDGDRRFIFSEFSDDFGQMIQSRTHGHADGDIVAVAEGEVLSLFDCPLQLIVDIVQGRKELFAGRR